jgi:hypothetical protein
VAVFLSDVGRFRELARDEVIVFRVIRGIASRFGRQNFILIQDAAYRVEKRIGSARKEPKPGDDDDAGGGVFGDDDDGGL